MKLKSGFISTKFSLRCTLSLILGHDLSIHCRKALPINKKKRFSVGLYCTYIYTQTHKLTKDHKSKEYAQWGQNFYNFLKYTMRLSPLLELLLETETQYTANIIYCLWKTQLFIVVFFPCTSSALLSFNHCPKYSRYMVFSWKKKIISYRL